MLEFYLYLVNSQICGYSSYHFYPDILVTSCLDCVGILEVLVGYSDFVSVQLQRTRRTPGFHYTVI